MEKHTSMKDAGKRIIGQHRAIKSWKAGRGGVNFRPFGIQLGQKQENRS